MWWICKNGRFQGGYHTFIYIYTNILYIYTHYIHIIYILYTYYIHIIYTYCREDSPRRSPLASSRSDAGDPQHSAEGNAAADPRLLDLGLQGAGQGEWRFDVVVGVEGWSPRGWWKGELMFEGSLEVKLPTIWRDEKQSRAEAQRRGRLEERR